MDRSGYVDVYTDGSCLGNGQTGADAGIGVYFGDNHPLNVSRPAGEGYRRTNNAAEIEAVTEAARQATRAGVDKLRINTDSEFLIKCHNEYMPTWKENGWKKADGKDVVNRQELMEMDRALKPLDVAWKHVPGHSGNRGNEMADKLARAGASSRRRN